MIRKRNTIDDVYDIECNNFDTEYYKLAKDFIDELEDNRKEFMEGEYDEETILEFADSHVPVYNWDIIETWSSDSYLWYEVDATDWYVEEDDIIRRMMKDICWALEQEGLRWFNYNKEKYDER